jgi:MFS transporter, DHA1 family, multidrug resistance protein
VPFVMFFTMASLPQTVIPLLGAGDLELSAAAVGLALALGGVCRFVGNLGGGWVSDRVSRKAALVPGLGLSAAGAALLAWEGQLWAWVAAIVVLGLASFPISVATAVLTDLIDGRRVGRALGPFRFVGDLGMIIGPFMVTVILERAGTGPAVLTVAALLAAAAVACALAIPETGRARG